MNPEAWATHHQLYWAVLSIISAVPSVVWLYGSLRGLFRQLPRGLRAAQRAYRSSTLIYLEAYLRDPGRLTRIILAQVAYEFVVFGLLALLSAHRLATYPFQYTDDVSGLSLFVRFHLAALSVAVETLLLMFVIGSLSVLLLVWLYRDPLRRVARLRKSLGVDDAPTAAA